MRKQRGVLRYETNLALFGRNAFARAKNRAAGNFDLTAVGRIKTRDQAQQGGLARSAAAKNRDELVFGNIQVDVLENRLSSEAR
jgi:hypothetical protein